MEAAVTIPLLFLLVLILLQSGIVLYDRIVMGDAAAQGCRVLATSTDGSESAEEFVLRRLGAVPQQDLFHVHGGEECSWRVECIGSSAADVVRVKVTNEVRPVPLIGAGVSLLNVLNERGNLEFSVEVSMPVRQAWLAGAEVGVVPAGWIGAWLDE